MFSQIDLFTDALGLQEPWKVIDVKFDIRISGGTRYHCEQSELAISTYLSE